MLYEDLFRKHIEEIWGWDDGWQAENFESEWKNSETKVIVHESSDVGFVQIQDKDEPPQLYILSLGVSASHQRLGIGTLVMQELMQAAMKRKIPVRLNVFETNPEALRFYSELGFEKTSRSDVGVTLEWKGVAPTL